MGTDLPIGIVCSFLLVLARVSGATIFVPIPGMSASPEPVRVLFALSLTVALAPFWPDVRNANAGAMLIWLGAETALGITIGLVVALAGEAFCMFGQMTGLQAGYSFASTIDPTTQADSGVLVAFSQIAAGLLFYTLGLDRQIIAAFALSLERTPPGSFALTADAAGAVIRLSSGIFSVGLRLALPVLAFLLMIDISLALLGRVQNQLQLLTVAFPLKMLSAIALLALMCNGAAHVYREYAARAFEILPRLAGR